MADQYHRVDDIPLYQDTSRFSVIWEDEGNPWSYWTVEDVEYNIDITDMINETQELGGVMQ